MTSSESLSFDRAADIYDESRALRPEVAAALTDALVRELRAIDARRVLEIGIGTGRIARPLAERGFRITGVDISTRMMGQLVAQLTPEHVAPDLLVADATELPFRDGVFDAVVICHVLHLIPPWQKAVAELKRTVRSGGIVLNTGEENQGESAWDAAYDLWVEQFSARGFQRRKRPRPEDMLKEAQSLGAKCELFNAAEWVDVSTPQQELDWARQRLHSWSWDIPDEVLDPAIPVVERWARERFGDLDAPIEHQVAQVVQVWRFP
jgi:ubiquinone/menaquinone biosynthesis C-methylase UbiE